MSVMEWLVRGVYFLAAVLLILGLKRMSSPCTARDGIRWAGIGMLLAVLVTFFLPGMQHRGLMFVAIGAVELLGGAALLRWPAILRRCRARRIWCWRWPDRWSERCRFPAP